MIAFIDDRLNHITMYRLVLYYAAALLVIAVGLGFFGLVPADPTALVFSTVFILAICFVVNRMFALVLKVPENNESFYITALILALIMPPAMASDLPGLCGLALASVVAIGSKFLLAIQRKHIFNPAAIGVLASSVILDQPATWWGGSGYYMLVPVLIGGLLVVRKVQRFEMIVFYVLANLIATLATTAPEMYGEAFSQTLAYSPLFFAGFAMLTEPLTAPHARIPSLAYGVIVGALSSPSLHIGEFYFTPEIAFLVGNFFAFAISPKGRFKLTLVRIEKAAHGCYDFVFRPDRQPVFQAGQYLDWTLAVRNADNRGNRRPFTIASAPTDGHVRLGVKFYESPSAFKHALANMKPGDTIYGSHISGSFTLPKNSLDKLAFIAGGIGVTPFRSMVQGMIDRKEQRQVVMLYGNNKADEVAYGDLFQQAEQEIGMRTVYAIAKDAPEHPNVHSGFIDAELIRREIPDYGERTFYISGPRSMVLRFHKVLKELGVIRSRIKVDFFPGFA